MWSCVYAPKLNNAPGPKTRKSFNKVSKILHLNILRNILSNIFYNIFGFITLQMLLFSCSGRLKIADLGLSRIFLREDELKDDSDTNNESSEASRRRIRQRQYSHQVATRWYR